MAHRSMIGCVLFVVIILCGSPALAQNLVSNGEFDINVAGWTPYGIGFEWDPSDWSGDPSSGSGLATNDADGYMHAAIHSCVDGIVAGQRYDLGGMIAIPSGQSGGGSAGFGFYWLDGTGCSGTQTWGGSTPYVVVSDTWIHLGLWNLEAPSGAQSVQVAIFNEKTSSGTNPFVSHHDGIYFGVFGGIFTDGFETGITYEWSEAVP